jgi:hypothetical protein
MIEVYNFLDGKNLCNIFASLIVEKIEELVPNSHTEISVINVGYFFVIKGFTSSDEKVNCNTLLSDFLLMNYNITSPVRVFEFIEYSKNIIQDSFNINVKYDKYLDSKINNFQKILNDFKLKGIDLTIGLNLENKEIFYHCSLNDSKTIIELLRSDYNDYYKIPHNFDKTFISDRYFGLSNCLEKQYIKLSKNIFYLLSIKGVISYIDFSITVDNNGYLFNINDLKSIVKKEWLESLILDIFPFESDRLLGFFENDLSYKEITDEDHKISWKKLEVLKDVLLY